MKLFDTSKYTVSEAKPFPLILLLDVSSSMNTRIASGKTRIDDLNQAVAELFIELKKQVEFTYQVSVITFGSQVRLHTHPTDVQTLQWHNLQANGMTPLAIALEMAHDLLEDTSQIPKRCFQPTVLLVSDGEPNGRPWEPALHKFLQEGRSKHCDRMAIAIGEDAIKPGKARKVLEKFIEGSPFDVVFEASDAWGLTQIFRQITEVVTKKSQRLSTKVPGNQQSTTTGVKQRSSIPSNNGSSVTTSRKTSFSSRSIQMPAADEDSEDY